MKGWLKRHYSLVVTVMAVASAFLISTVSFVPETAAEGSPSDIKQTLLAGITPDYEGVDTLDLAEKPEKDVNVAVGLGVGVVPDYEGSDDYGAAPLLFARVTCSTGRYVEFLANRLEANILTSDTWTFGPMVRYRVKRDDDVDNDQVSRMRDVDASVEAGAFLGVKVGRWSANIRVGKDVADGHDGSSVRFSVGYTIPVDQTLSYGLNVFTTYADDDYMDAYFDVDANNAFRSGLAVFDAEGGIKDVGGMLHVRYNPWKKWGVMGGVGYTRLVGDAEDSPVVDVAGDAGQYFAGVMAIYRF